MFQFSVSSTNLQYWGLFNLDTGEEGHMGGVFLYYQIFYKPQSWLSTILTIPKISSDKLKADLKVWLTGNTALAPRPTETGLLRLPNELLLEIIVLLQRKNDLTTMVSLACTCQRLLCLAVKPIEKVRQKLHAPWVGCRLICAGESAASFDLPAGLLTEGEQQQLLAAETMPEDADGEEDDGAASFGGLPALCSRQADFPLHPPFDVSRFASSQSDHARFEALFFDDEGFAELKAEELVLFNLTTGECVRAATLLESRYRSRPWEPKGYNLSHAILYKIAWSRDPSGCIVEYYEGDAIWRGVWAGHRFCITTMDRMPALPEGKKDWEDISDDVAKDLDIIW